MTTTISVSARLDDVETVRAWEANGRPNAFPHITLLTTRIFGGGIGTTDLCKAVESLELETPRFLYQLGVTTLRGRPNELVHVKTFCQHDAARLGTLRTILLKAVPSLRDFVASGGVMHSTLMTSILDLDGQPLNFPKNWPEGLAAVDAYVVTVRTQDSTSTRTDQTVIPVKAGI